MHFKRALTALLLGGWLLMLPPLDKDREPDDTVPVTQWQHHSAYDTAKACQHAGQENFNDSLQALERAARKKEPDRSVLKVLRNLMFQAAAYRCIPAEHIYPPAQQSNPTP